MNPSMPSTSICAVLAMLLLGAASSALAQKTYRCGSTYQSFPCAGTVGGSSAGAATKGATVAAKPAAPAAAAAAVAIAAPAAAAAPLTDAEKKAAVAKAVEAEKKAKCDKMINDLNYNNAQQKSGGSKTTMDRLAGERTAIEADMKKDSCKA